MAVQKETLINKTAEIDAHSRRYLLVACDAPSDALQLGVTDLSELVLRHGNHAVALGDELAAVPYKETVIAAERLQDLWRQERLMRTDLPADKSPEI